MLFRRSAATTRAHQEEAIRRRKSGRNSLRADRHRRRTGQAGREDFAKFCLSGCSAQECREVRVACGDLKRHWPFEAPTEPTGETSSLRRSRTAVLPSGYDALRHILLGYYLAHSRRQICSFAAPRCPYPAHGALCVTPQKGEMVTETDPTQWPRRKARHL